MATVTYYFNARGASGWTNPDNMIDGSTDTFASALADAITAILSGNDCPGTDLGTITKVEMRAYAAGDADDNLALTPVFAAGNGTKKLIAPGTTPTWIAYQDITTDTNAPSPWTFAAVVVLDMIVGAEKVGKANTMKCYRVEVRITYELYPEAPTSFASPSQTENSIDLTWTKGANSDKTLIRFRDDQYPTGITDGTLAYFDTGVSVIVSAGPPILQESHNTIGGASRVAERINNFPIATITKVSFCLSKTADKTGTAYIRVRKVSDDSVVGEVASFEVGDLTTSPVWYDFDCDIDNLVSQDLRFSVEFGLGLWIRFQDTDVLANAVYSYFSDPVWYDNSARDVAIRVYWTLAPGSTYYFRAWGYQSSTGLYSTATADLTQATSGVGWTHIAKVNSVAAASMAKINGVAVASVAKVNGVAV